MSIIKGIREMSKLFRICFILFSFLSLPFLTITVLGAEDCSFVNGYQNAIVYIKVIRFDKVTGAAYINHGTGFVISGSGYVLTANHVIEVSPNEDSKRTGTLGSINGTPLDLDVVETIPEHDIALLKFTAANNSYQFVPVGDPSLIKPGNDLCSAGFTPKLLTDFSVEPGALTNNTATDEKGRLKWQSNLSSVESDSGSPVFSKNTGMVVAMKWGIVQSVPNSPPPTPSNFQLKTILTPLNFVATVLKNHLNIDLGVSGLETPKLACTENPLIPYVNFQLNAECKGCNPTSKSNVKIDWGRAKSGIKNELSDGSGAIRPAIADTSIELTCKKSKGNYNFGLKLQQSALAGGAEGNFLFSESSIFGAANNVFTITNGKRFCLSVKNYVHDSSTVKGYPESDDIFSDDVKKPMITLETPNGDNIDLVPGTKLPLNEIGTWQFWITVDKTVRSNWFKDSGKLTISNLLEFQFTKQLADGSCQ
jgi:hypothetical protein